MLERQVTKMSDKENILLDPAEMDKIENIPEIKTVSEEDLTGLNPRLKSSLKKSLLLRLLLTIPTLCLKLQSLSI